MENLPEALENDVFSGLPMLTKPRFSIRKRWEKNLFVFFSVVAMMFWGFGVVFTMFDPQRGLYGSQYIRLNLASLATMMNWWICSKIEVGQRLQFGILAAGLAQS